MKNLKLLTIVGILALFLVAWKGFIENSITQEEQYKDILKEAEVYRTKQIYTKATENYLQALKMRESEELRKYIAEYYKETLQESAYEDWMNKYIEQYPLQIYGYENLAQFYYDRQDYEKFMKVKHQCDRRKLSSELITKCYNDSFYEYKLSSTQFCEMNRFSNGYSQIKNNKNLYGFINDSGDQIIGCDFLYAAPIKDDDEPVVYAAPVKDDDEPVVNMEELTPYFMTLQGEKMESDIKKQGFVTCGAYSMGCMPVKKQEKYYYVDKDFNILFGDYDYASMFTSNVAVVKKENKWWVIDNQGQQISQSTFDDFIIDDIGSCFRFGAAFAKLGDSYYMVDINGNKISEQKFEDAKSFETNEPTAVKINGKWGFVDLDGQIVIEPQYEDARPVAYDLAAVKVNGKWGYYSLSAKKIVIDPIFLEARELTSKGVGFVKEVDSNNDNWKLLKFYHNL